LNGVEVVKTKTPVVEISKEGTGVATVNKEITLIPYYAWANRGAGEMMIWFPSTIKDLDLLSSNESGRSANPK
jgi:hypothetical protein